MNEVANDYTYFNYTRVTDLYGKKYNLAPRFHWTSVHEDVYFVDLKREAEIGVGVSASWLTDLDLGPDECAVSHTI